MPASFPLGERQEEKFQFEKIKCILYNVLVFVFLLLFFAGARACMRTRVCAFMRACVCMPKERKNPQSRGKEVKKVYTCEIKSKGG